MKKLIFSSASYHRTMKFSFFQVISSSLLFMLVLIGWSLVVSNIGYYKWHSVLEACFSTNCRVPNPKWCICNANSIDKAQGTSQKRGQKKSKSQRTRMSNGDSILYIWYRSCTNEISTIWLPRLHHGLTCQYGWRKFHKVLSIDEEL